MGSMRILAATALVVLALAGCSAEQPGPSTAGAASGGGMGMGGSGATEGVPEEVMGVVAASQEATVNLGIPASSPEGVLVTRVIAPASGWLVVRSANPGGAVLGSIRVSAGETRNVVVPLTAAVGRSVTVALHVDRGSEGRLEAEPVREGRSPDAMVYVERIPVRRIAELSAYGVDVEANSALVLVEDQELGDADRIAVEYLIVPASSWVSVHESRDGVAGERIGSIAVAAGEWHEIVVPLTRRPATREVVVRVCADRGEPGRLECVDDDPLGSVDQPYVSAGIVVAKTIRLD